MSYQRGHHKKGRLIIRNLSFKVTENTLKQKFSEFGNIIDVNIPKKPDGKMRGFGFIEFEKTASAIKAINGCNAKEFLGRPIAVDFAIAKNKYEQIQSQRNQMQSNALNNTVTIKEKKTDKPLVSTKRKRNEDLSDDESSEDGIESNENEEDESEDLEKNDESSEDETGSKNSKEVENESSDDDDDENENSEDEAENENSDDEAENENSEDEKDEPLKKKIKLEKSKSSDVSEGRTLFIRNLSFDSTADDLKDVLSKYGAIKYCILCTDPLTEYSKGTAFVQFVNKDDAEKCLVENNSFDNTITLSGRKLNISLALTPEEVKKRKDERSKKGKDNRNLHLLPEGLIRPGSEAAEGVSQTDLTKRLQLEAFKKKLLKNLHYFISPVRLCVHNLPPSTDDKKLKKIFVNAAGSEAKITEAKVMRNLKKLDAQGIGESKCFGFVCFTKHEDALEALRKLNNNPDTFTPNKRPIVEFSIENRHIVNAKKRKMEKQIGKNKFTQFNKNSQKKLERNITEQRINNNQQNKQQSTKQQKLNKTKLNKQQLNPKSKTKLNKQQSNPKIDKYNKRKRKKIEKKMK